MPSAAPPSPDADLRAARDRLGAWMRGLALPLWATAGHDGPGGGFAERLTLAGRPHPAALRRVRVQARQVYVFAHAAVLGHAEGAGLAAAAMRRLEALAWDPARGWARALDRDGRVLDPALDLYDVAFVLLALAWLVRATGEAAPRALAHRTLDRVEARLRVPGVAGFASAAGPGVPPPDAAPREQNPHMHLLEAALAWRDLHGDARFGALAAGLLALAADRLIDPATGTLAERFGPDWAPLPGETRIEPGHQCEWAWLLARAGGGWPEAAARLDGFARRHGRDAGGLLVDAVAARGDVLEPDTRLWPQTEALKATLARPGPGRGGAAHAIVEAVFRHFLDPAPPGGWIDHRRAPDGRGVRAARVDFIPASSLYHLFAAHAELERAAGPGA